MERHPRNTLIIIIIIIIIIVVVVVVVVVLVLVLVVIVVVVVDVVIATSKLQGAVESSEPRHSLPDCMLTEGLSIAKEEEDKESNPQQNCSWLT